MRDLLILGTGVHAAEMAELVERVEAVHPTWRLRGYLAPEPNAAGGSLNGYPILGAMNQLADFPDAVLLPAFGWPRSLPVPRDRLVSLIDPSTFVSRTAAIGLGCVLYPHCYVGLNARLGDHVFCLSGCLINHDTILEDRVVLASGVTLAGLVHVEEECYLGQGCVIRQELRIGRGSLIGMGAVVVNDVPPNSVIVGNPGRRLRDRTPIDPGAAPVPGGERAGQSESMAP
jgi:sugar O-acyltransferase (sialic acid O-acetyltransferase NeuD family)